LLIKPVNEEREREGKKEKQLIGPNQWIVLRGRCDVIGVLSWGYNSNQVG
jgi:hypothetical protein